MWSVHFSSVFEIFTCLTNTTSGKLQGVMSSQNVELGSLGTPFLPMLIICSAMPGLFFSRSPQGNLVNKQPH